MTRHHPSDAQLLGYANGELAEPLALLVATHLALCPRCRAEVARLEALGGLLLEELPPAQLPAGSLEDVMARLDTPEPASSLAPPEAAPLDTRIPRPLRDYIGGPPEALNWHTFRGLHAARLMPERDDCKTYMLWIEAGRAFPVHGHEGNEATLVLTGSFADGGETYARGDVALAGPETNHRPVADQAEDCICLVVYDGTLRLTGPYGRWLNPILRL
ncbi:MAG: ChrR family anti-sigma-E factor [Pseudomonadota bacterium]